VEQKTDEKILTFRCPPELVGVLPEPIPAVLGLPEWFKAMPQRVVNPRSGYQLDTLKRCPPFIDAMTYGFLIPLATDLKVQDGEFTWNTDLPLGTASDHAISPIDFHDPVQAAGSPFFDDDRYIIKFVNFWAIEAPPGYSLLFTHPVNRRDLPFTALTGLVDCDAYRDVPVQFPAHWHDASFNGVLPKGTPLVQCLPVKRETWSARCEALAPDAMERFTDTNDSLRDETAVYRRNFRTAKR
jgi:hypothetical protein